MKGPASPVATLDVVSEKGARVWAVRPVYVSATEEVITTIAFIIDRAVEDAEFRIMVADQTVGEVHGYELTKIE